MLTLGISTSSPKFSLVLGKGTEILYNSDQYEIAEPKEIGLFLEKALEAVGEPISSIKNIIVDNGPGGTSRVRTGVAFANSIAYSLGVPVNTVSSLVVAGMDFWETKQQPVICTVKSLNNNAFIGIYTDKEYKKFYGKIKEILPRELEGIDQFTVVGFHRDMIKELFPLKDIWDAEKFAGNVETLITKQAYFTRQPLHFPVIANPITEGNFELV